VPENSNVSADELRQWYYQGSIIGAVLGGLVGVGFGAFVPRIVVSRRGEASGQFHGRVIGWGIGGMVAGVVLTVLVTLQLAYGKADWQLSPSERLSLVAGSGRYSAVLASACLVASIVFSVMVSSRAWNGRGAITGR